MDNEILKVIQEIIKNEIQPIKNDIKDIKEDVSKLKDDVTGVKKKIGLKCQSFFHIYMVNIYEENLMKIIW